MTGPTVHDGWLIVPCDVPDTSSVEIKVTSAQASPSTRSKSEWIPAFRDWHDGTRVAKIRHVPSGRSVVHLRAAGVEAHLGTVG